MEVAIKANIYLPTSFRPQNSSIYVKFSKDCIYIMFLRENIEIKFMLKIKYDFMNNPIISISGRDIHDSDLEEYDLEEDNNNVFNAIKKNIDVIFERQEKTEKLYIEELSVFQVENSS